jgi:RimJ/RimL family protein N-acetyltransferase
VASGQAIPDTFKPRLESLPGITAISDVRVGNGFLASLNVQHAEVGAIKVERATVGSASGLYEFYFSGLSAKAREYFPPYPLFSPPVGSVPELAGRIRSWLDEDDWTVLTLSHSGQVAAMGMLKRFRTPRPTSGLAVRESYQQKGIGRLVQTLIIEQARLLGLDRIFATLAEDNVASRRLHLACGFRLTENRVPHYGYRSGERFIDRWDVEMVWEAITA